MPCEAEFEVAFHVGPFRRENAVDMGVARGAVAARHVMADDAIPSRRRTIQIARTIFHQASLGK